MMTFYICNILYLLEQHRKITGGVLQFRNIQVEDTLLPLLTHIRAKLSDSTYTNKLDESSLLKLGGLINETTTYEAFESALEQSIIYGMTTSLLKEMEQKGHFKQISDHSRWCVVLMYLELNIMYESYYGKKDLRATYTQQHKLEEDLLLHLMANHPEYYKRLRRLKLVESGPLDHEL
jgi:hypothetical protein